MKILKPVCAGLIAVATSATLAQSSELMSNIPASSRTVTDWYKQNVYDPKDQKIGEIMDVLVNPSGQVEAAIVGVGGFLGAGEKDVAVSFDAIKAKKKDNKTYLTLDTTKDALKSASGFKYDRQSTTWVPDTNSDNSAKK